MEEVQVTESVQDVPTEIQSEKVESVEAPVETSAEKPVEQAQEKMIPQSQVNKIAAREARQAAEKARNEMRAEFERQQVHQEVKP